MANTWAATSFNETVSFNTLADAVATGVLSPLNTIPASNEEITKDEAGFYVCLNTGHTSYANKTGNQLVVKADLVSCYYTPPSFLYNGYLYYRQDAKGVFGWDSTVVCSEGTLGSFVSVGWDTYLGLYSVLTADMHPYCLWDNAYYLLYYNDPYYGPLYYSVRFQHNGADPVTGLCTSTIVEMSSC